MRRALVELLIAGACIAAAAALFGALAGSARDPGDATPHAMAFAGIALMLWAEVAHSLRRRNHARSRLPARLSLSAHVVAGLVGPALILMHTHWQLRGLAGVVTIMTLLVVASGVAGRFVYPSVSGPEHPTARRAVAGWHLVHVPLATATLALALVHAAAAAYFGVGIR